jgi:predicted ATPase
VTGVAEILRRAPHVKVLVTSRVVLRLRAEHEYEVGPLMLPDAAALFTTRARALAPGFRREPVVDEICRRLDCLPLALELAASRIRILTAGELLDRLVDRLPLLTGGPPDAEERQRTLRATIDWSYGLLTPAEQEAFARVAVFRGGCSLDAAEAVAGADPDTIASLVDNSLVLRVDVDGESRFGMLETIREYALERLEDRPESTAVHRAHAEHMLELARTARGFARGPEAIPWLDRTQLELDNFRAALGWTIDSGEAGLGLAIAEALEPFWYRRLQLREGLRWLEPLLELTPGAPPALRGAALATAGRLAAELGDAARARPLYEESLPLARAAGDRTTEAWILHGLGFVSAREGDRATARELLEQSHSLFLELGQHAPAAGRLTYLAYLARLDGDLESARRYTEGSIEHYGIAGDSDGVAGSTIELGDLDLAAGDIAAAAARYGEALGNYGETRNLMYLCGGLGAVAAASGEPHEASVLWGAALRLESEVDQGIEDVYRTLYESRLGELEPEQVEAGRAMPLDDVVALAGEVVSRASG